MKLFRANNYNGEVLSVVIAESREHADIFWQGAGIFPHSVDAIGRKAIEATPTGVLELV